MIKEEVILHREQITKLGQSCYFQVKLPRDTKYITGIETGAIRKISGATVGRMDAYTPATSNSPVSVNVPFADPLFVIDKVETIGRLTLCSPVSTDIFYQEEVRQKDIAHKYADFTQYLDVFDQWTHDRHRYETTVRVSNCVPVVEGHFKDSWGSFGNYHVVYRLNIYIWIEKQ